MSLFVNPAQFDDPADLERYPRDETADLQAARAAATDIVFAPPVDELYPPMFDTWVDPGALGRILEGAVRPGHFRGVATVCTKLLGIVEPHRAWFGQKDAQQVAVIRRVVRDLDLEVEIVAVPTVRDADGLALSSRNARLGPREREAGLALPRALAAGHAAHRDGRDALAAARAVLAAEPDLGVDYVELVDLDGPTLVAAVRAGGTRLIDNVRLSGDS
jgi:pantoate--beta-alanine ligase